MSKTEQIAVENRSHNIFELFSGDKKVSSSIRLSALHTRQVNSGNRRLG